MDPRQGQDKKEELKARLTEERKKKYDLLTSAFRQVFSSPEGKLVLRHIKDLSNYQRTFTKVNSETSEILLDNVIYNSARRDLYLTLRDFLTKEILADVEL